MMYSMASEITVHFTVSANSTSYLKYAYLSYINLARSRAGLNFHFYCLDFLSYITVKYWEINCKHYFVGRASGSLGHANAIDYAIQKFDTKSINIISDTDVAVVKSGWDSDLFELFEARKLHVIGAQYENIGGFSTGASKVQTYKNKPSATWIAFSPLASRVAKSENLSMKPHKEGNLPINSAFLSDMYGLPIGFELVRDVGWQIPKFIEQHNISSTVFEHRKPSHELAQVLIGSSEYHDEFHLNGIPFLVHQRGSRHKIYKVDSDSKVFYEAVDKFMGNPIWSPGPTLRDFSFYVFQTVKIFIKRFLKSGNFKRRFHKSTESHR